MKNLETYKQAIALS